MKHTKSMVYRETDDSRELYLFAVNDGQLWRDDFAPRIRALQRHARRGDYSHDRAVDSLFHTMTAAAHKYQRIFRSPGFSFPVQVRFTCAVKEEAYIFEEYIKPVLNGEEVDP